MTAGLTTNFMGGANAIDLHRGLTRAFKLTVQKSGEKYDLTDTTLFLTVKRDASDAQNLLQKTSREDGGIEIEGDARDGVAIITFSAANTSVFDAGEYVFDITLETDDDERYLLVGPGVLTVHQGVTRF